MSVVILFALPLVAGVMYWLRARQKRARRARLLAMPLSALHHEIVARNLPVANLLPEAIRLKLWGRINVFLDEKRFSGCQGLEVDDEIRVTIAAQACLLIVNNQSQNWYNRLTTILVYPNAYVSQTQQASGGGVIQQGKSVRLGESWGTGTIVLAWDASRRGGINFNDGHNVVIHEFAHQLDQVDGSADGIPTLGANNCYQTWARLLGEEYARLVRDTRKSRKTVLDEYGATNIAEFFAVSTECFFEKPRQLAGKHPELYDELMHYYGLDPREWHAAKAA